MSLYYEAASILSNADKKGGSLKSRVFGAKDLKNPAPKVYALLAESLKWSPILKDVIEKAELLRLERKLSPALAVLLTHDLLLAKKGVAAHKDNALRIAIEKHKARLSSEFTRARIRNGFGSVEAWRSHINTQMSSLNESGSETMYRHPRWVRVNALKSSLERQLKTTFKDYRKVDELEELLQAVSKERILHIDRHIPDLLALPYGHDLSKTEAYLKGGIIFQDKASCFPAYMLTPSNAEGDIIDTCAAPGNKTTHLAALTPPDKKGKHECRVFAFERNPHRSTILRKMVTRAGGDEIITVRGSTDFMTVNPSDQQYANVEALLLDPSCSGTGIVGRDDEPQMVFPKSYTATANGSGTSKNNKKRKRGPEKAEKPPTPREVVHEDEENEAVDADKSLQERLETLSAFQLNLLLHAMSFPAAKKISYSTCSIHAQENEHVVMRALASNVARERGWRILRRSEQPEGLRAWDVRGSEEACQSTFEGAEAANQDFAHLENAEVAEACIRCDKGTKDGTMGFFVAAFVRDGEGQRNGSGGNITMNGQGKAASEALPTPIDETTNNADEEWNGFSDSD